MIDLEQYDEMNRILRGYEKGACRRRCTIRWSITLPVPHRLGTLDLMHGTFNQNRLRNVPFHWTYGQGSLVDAAHRAAAFIEEEHAAVGLDPAPLVVEGT